MSNARPATLRAHSSAYDIFILVLTIVSLALMVILLLPLDESTRQLVMVYDNVICIVFLIDFAMNLLGARPKRAYFFGQRGWLDLLGSLPALGIVQFAVLFRLARLSRLARILRMLRGQQGRELAADVLANRGQYAAVITVLAAGIVLVTASILVLQFESRSPDANIKDGGDALWWGIVTITTVGYGDRYPVTMLGRSMGVLVMFAGIGIIGALASILASLLVSPSAPEPAVEPEAPAGRADAPAVAAAALSQELGAIRAEVAALHAEITGLRGALGISAAGGTAPRETTGEA